MRANGKNALGLTVFAIAVASAPGLAWSQSGTTSRPVVQAIPTQEGAGLSEALREVSRRPRDIQALIKAGDASLEAGDLGAAERFFRRIKDLSPSDARAKLGLAAVAVRKEDPFTALRLFDEAQAEGVDSTKYSGDHGLAYDLVGDYVRAQRFYKLSMAVKPKPEMSRRLALSQAISGDIRGAETTLLPLLRKEDLGAFRTRAFALAIAGKQEEAMAIAETLMPAASAKRLEPYLNSMPKLTPAQQAAAGNFGHFPLAAEIGKDDPRIAAYANGAVPPAQLARETGDRLVPQGQPLGPTAATAPQLAQASTASSAQAEPETSQERVVRTASRDLRTASDPLARTRGRRTQVVSAKPANAKLAPVQVAAAQPATSSPSVSALPPSASSSGELPAIEANAASSGAVVVSALPSAQSASPATSNAAPTAIEAAPAELAVVNEFPPMVPPRDGAPNPTGAGASTEANIPAPSINIRSTTEQLAQNASAPTSATTVSSQPAGDLASVDPTQALTTTAAPAEATPLDAVVVSQTTPGLAAESSGNAADIAEPIEKVAQGSAVSAATEEAGPAATSAVPTFDLAEATEPAVTVAQAAPAPVEIARAVPTASEPADTATEPAPLSVADAFAGFDLGEPSISARPTEAVDLTQIAIPRETASEETEDVAAPVTPSNASRVWVQIATGQDTSALRFDFRRISRKAPDLFEGKSGFTAKWNSTNRLVTGPFEGAAEARRFVNELKEKEIESFTFTSEDGQEVDPLPKR